MNRTYDDWERDARGHRAGTTKLGNELRDRWDDWKSEAPYKTFDECIMAELGITAAALRERNYKARKRAASVTDVTAATQDDVQPVRQKMPSTAEIGRRRDHVLSLWGQGHTARQIAEVLGVSRKTIEVDMAASGADGRRPKSSLSREAPEVTLYWRNEDLDIPDTKSTTEQQSFAACDTPSATEAIEDVRVQLSLILGGRYRLSLKDRNNLITILEKALGRLHNGANQDAESSSHNARVAG
jgi:hypothetical protein